jgi:ribosomal protein S18 acetylase RimI-like enzyme
MQALTYRIVPAGPEHGPAMIELLPNLASFEIPTRREPEHLWHGDLQMVEDWLAGNRAECFARAALDENNQLLGYAFVTMREELLSHEPSAHLEVLVVHERARRMRIGEALTSAVEVEAASRGARTITLHVFHNNHRARGLYAKLGFDEELIRCIKDLD